MAGQDPYYYKVDQYGKTQPVHHSGYYCISVCDLFLSMYDRGTLMCFLKNQCDFNACEKSRIETLAD